MTFWSKTILIAGLLFCVLMAPVATPIAAQEGIFTYAPQAININKPKTPPSAAPVANNPEPLTQQVYDPPLPEPAPVPVLLPPEETLENTYHLAADDHLQIVTFGEDDLSGKFRIGSDGALSFPLAGKILAAGLTLEELERAIEDRLAEGYLKSPDVSITLLENRPFYILGEVRQPGSYNYVSGMTVLKAVAIGGGYTYRANQKKVEILRGSAVPSEPFTATPEDTIMPGDIIVIKERLF